MPIKVEHRAHPFSETNDYMEEGALRTRVFRWLLSHVVEEGRELVDLGAGPCVFAKHAAKAGYRVTAVDGRTSRVPDDLPPSITFVEADVRDYEVAESVSHVAILGLLYHLTLDDQINLLTKLASRRNRTVILDTQVHFPDSIQVEASRKRGDWAFQQVEQRGFHGVLFPEGDNAMASIGNTSSFWHTEDSLLGMLEATGYEECTVIEPIYLSKYGARKFYVATSDPLL